MIQVSIVLGVVIFCIALWAKFRTDWQEAHRRFVGALVIFYACLLASLTGSYTALVVPGLGKIALGTAAGAGLGFGVWVVLGTVGVATGGLGVAIGALGMSAIGAIFGGVGGAAGGFGLRQVTYSLVSPVFWLPLLAIGIYFVAGRRIKSRIVGLRNRMGRENPSGKMEKNGGD